MLYDLADMAVAGSSPDDRQRARTIRLFFTCPTGYFTDFLASLSLLRFFFCSLFFRNLHLARDW